METLTDLFNQYQNLTGGCNVSAAVLALAEVIMSMSPAVPKNLSCAAERPNAVDRRHDEVPDDGLIAVRAVRDLLNIHIHTQQESQR